MRGKENMKEDKTLKIESMYDYQHDILGIRVVGGYKYKESVELEEGVMLDFNKDNIPIALEILDASKVLNIPNKQCLSNRKNIQMNISISDEIIKVCLEVVVKIHNKEETMSVNSSTINYINAPTMQTELASI